MQTGEASPIDIYETALRVASQEELQEMPEQVLLTFMGAIERRLNKAGEPTDAELQGLKEMVTEDMWHPALSRLSGVSQD